MDKSLVLGHGSRQDGPPPKVVLRVSQGWDRTTMCS